MKFDKLKTIADAIAAVDVEAAVRAVDLALQNETGAHWQRDLAKLRATLIDNVPRFTIIAEGNGKLPFLAFSALPGKGFCPGAGDCLQFCYSFRAWRYPAAFARQAQNAWLLRSFDGRAAIERAIDTAAPRGVPVDFRLYVDGDFSDVPTLAYWMDVLRARPWLRTYGYSKSWDEFQELEAQGFAWPQNYRLNLSSGSLHGDAERAAMERLPVTRGEFIAVPMGKAVKAADHGNRAHQAELRAAFGRKAFACPGKCGDCTPKGHACGSDRFRNVPIIIAVH